MKLKKHKKKRIGDYISLSIIIVFFSLIFALIVINYFSKRANKILFPMASEQTRKVVTMIINSACDESIISENLYVIDKDDNSEIKMIIYNSFEVTKLINEVTANVEEKIKLFENGELDYYGNTDKIENGVIWLRNVFLSVHQGLRPYREKGS